MCISELRSLCMNRFTCISTTKHMFDPSLAIAGVPLTVEDSFSEQVNIRLEIPVLLKSGLADIHLIHMATLRLCSYLHPWLLF